MRTILFILFVFGLVCGTYSMDYLWSASEDGDGNWFTADNWTPSGVPSPTDNVAFTQSNVTMVTLQPVTVRNVRLSLNMNLTFMSSLNIVGSLRMSDGLLQVMGDLFINGTVDLSTGSITCSQDVTIPNEFRWASGEIAFYGTAANIDTLTITGGTGLMEGPISINVALNILDSSRYMQDVVITIGPSAIFFISATTTRTLLWNPLTDCQIFNYGYLHGVFTMLDQSSALVSFGVQHGITPTVTLQNMGDILLEGNGFLEVSVMSQRSGSLNMLSYSTQEVGLRTNPNTLTYILGGSISGNGFIDTEVWMSDNTALYLSATNNITITAVNFAGNALMQVTLFDASTHGILLTGSFNRRSGVGGTLQVVFGNGPNALLSSVPSSMTGVHTKSRSTRTAQIEATSSTLRTGLASTSSRTNTLKGAEKGGKRRRNVEVVEAVVPVANNGSVANPTVSSSRDVVVKIGDLILLIAPLQFTNPLPTPSFISVEVENDQFRLTPAAVQWATSPSSSVIFYNVTHVNCPGQCSANGNCVFMSPHVVGVCSCFVAGNNLHTDCSEISYSYLAWIIAPAIFAVFLTIEGLYCLAEHKSRRRIVANPAGFPNIRPEVSAFRTEHRKSGVKRSFFDIATLFLFTTEIEGAARSYDMISKIILTMSTVAIGVLSIIPFTGQNKPLQQVFVGINAGLIFTLAVIQLAWTALKPRKIEFDVEVDDKKVSLWAPFNKETLSWILRALPGEMNKLYTPPIPYKKDEFAFVDKTLDMEMNIRDYFASFYRLPKVICTRNISTNPTVNSPSAPAQP